MTRMNHLAGIAGLTLMTLLTACTGNTRVNPFLEDWDTPYGIQPFDKIEYADYVPAFKAGIEQRLSDRFGTFAFKYCDLDFGALRQQLDLRTTTQLRIQKEDDGH